MIRKPRKKKTDDEKVAGKLARPVGRRLVKIEMQNPPPIAKAALKQIEVGLHNLLISAPPKPKKYGPKKERKKTSYMDWYSRFVKTPAYALLKVTYPDNKLRMVQVGAAWAEHKLANGIS